jgi:putative addiction module component (TIGR02574 family)
MKYPTREELLELSNDERLQLLEDVWETLDHERDPEPIPEWHKRIIDEAIEEMERNPDDEGVPIEEVFARFRAVRR